MGRNPGRVGECRNPSSSHRLPDDPKLRRGVFRKEGDSSLFEIDPRSLQAAADAGARPIGAGERPVSTKLKRNLSNQTRNWRALKLISEKRSSMKTATRRSTQTARGYSAGPRQCRPKQHVGESADQGSRGSGRGRKGTQIQAASAAVEAAKATLEAAREREPRFYEAVCAYRRHRG